MKLFFKIFLLLILIATTSCLDEEAVSTINFTLEDTAKLVKYVESQGDFPNSLEAPALILASELYSDINNYWIIDIRIANKFSQGHIVSAINVRPVDLKLVVDSLNLILPLRRIVIVSENGQSSAYFTCILRIAGYENIFSLNYGMTSWNILFSSEWLQALGIDERIKAFNNVNYPIHELCSLPKNIFPYGLNTIEEKINFRIDKILEDGFNEGIAYISYMELSTLKNNYIICYGKERLYYAPKLGSLAELGHPINTVLYNLYFFKSTRFLQSLPNSNGILIYSGNGQLSACMVAYLRFLGYDAKTLLFGANQLFYPRMQEDPDLLEDLFSPDDIMNYPYVTGN